MLTLPKGYYAVQADFENSPKDSFTFRGVTYSAKEGENLFGNINDAAKLAVDVPQTVLEGLPYESFTTPVILFSAGVNRIDGYQIKSSITLLGEGAGIDPNVFSEDPLVAPTLNPLRGENESVLYGGFDYGELAVSDAAAESIVFDGFVLKRVRLYDSRRDGGNVKIEFNNIIQEGTCGRTLIRSAAPKEDSKLYREIYFKNMRSSHYNDSKKGGGFANICAHKAVFDRICFDNTTQHFGFTNLSRQFDNSSPNADVSEFIIKDSYLANLQGEYGICTVAKGDKGVMLKAYNSVFVDASRKNEGVFQPDLSNELSGVYAENCTFVDTRENKGALVTPRGGKANIELKDCTIEGFAKEIEEIIIPTPTEYIENRAEAWTTDTEDAHKILPLNDADFAAMDAYYEGTKAYYGDMHVHTACGGTSDGSVAMSEWPAKLEENGIDFVVIVDHRQMRGFFLPEWDEKRFVMGTEPGTNLKELNAATGLCVIHYNMLFPHKYGVAMVMANFPEFGFKGDELTGRYGYPSFTLERFRELTAYVQSIGGMMVHPHPKDLLESDDPLDYYHGEFTHIEALYSWYESHWSFKGYELWTDILALGKRVYVSGGSDSHSAPSSIPFGVFYNREHLAKNFFDQMHDGDYAVGAVGMKMFVDGKPMGSVVEYKDGMKLTLRVDDFFPKMFKDNSAYELRIITDKGIAYSSVYDGKLPQAVELEVQKRAFYRAEIFDLTNCRFVAISNPIWFD